MTRSTIGSMFAGRRSRRQAEQNSTGSTTQTICLATALIVVGIFVFAIVRFYQPGYGFTALIGFPRGDFLVPAALRAVPHYEYPAVSYDGQFYATRALDPMLTNPSIDSEMDDPPFRARRILFSWTAYLAGFGRPALILDAYALQNAVAWLLLALLLCRWIPPTTPRGLAVWSASLLSHGLMWSVRFALLDGPSLLLIAVAVLLVEDHRTWASAAVAGIAGLARETNVLAALAQPFPRRARGWLRTVVVAAPLLVWLDYLRSIYRSTLFAGTSGELGVPGVGLGHTASATWHLLRTHGVLSAAGLNVCILLPLLIQAMFLVCFRHWRDPWWRVAAGYAALMAFLPAVLWAPETGAISRVMLPLTIGFNVLLAKQPRARFWPWFVAGNLHVIPALFVMPLLSSASL